MCPPKMLYQPLASGAKPYKLECGFACVNATTLHHLHVLVIQQKAACNTMLIGEWSGKGQLQKLCSLDVGFKLIKLIKPHRRQVL
jgi:hypothetical protein